MSLGPTIKLILTPTHTVITHSLIRARDGKSKGIYQYIDQLMYIVECISIPMSDKSGEIYIDIFDISEEIYRKIIQIYRGTVYWHKYK